MSLLPHISVLAMCILCEALTGCPFELYNERYTNVKLLKVHKCWEFYKVNIPNELNQNKSWVSEGQGDCCALYLTERIHNEKEI